MMPTRGIYGGILILIAAWAASNAVGALPAEDAVIAVAERLEQGQWKSGPNQGLWPGDYMSTGPATAGMICAYEWMGDPAYRQSAEFGGRYILSVSVPIGQLFADEVYAFVRLSQTSDDPNNNKWRTALVSFFKGNREQGETTAGYLRFFEKMDSSSSTFYIAHHTIGAYYVDDLDKETWREALIRTLARVDDKSAFPVMALGVATWALATTGPLDDTPVKSYGEAACWKGVVLSDLPGLLLSHQVPEGEVFAGSFYWRFDHTGGSLGGVASGYMEDAVYGALGLTAAAALETDAPDEDMKQAIRAAYPALLDGIDADGRVYEHLARAGGCYPAFAGEMLQGLWGIAHYLGSQEDEGAETAVNP